MIAWWWEEGADLAGPKCPTLARDCWGVLGHMADWDIRVLVLAEKIDRGEPWVAGDAEPEGDWLNDSTRPLIHAIAPR